MSVLYGIRGLPVKKLFSGPLTSPQKVRRGALSSDGSPFNGKAPPRTIKKSPVRLRQYRLRSPCTIAGRERTFPRGTLFALAELYGWSGKPDQGLKQSDVQQAIYAVGDWQPDQPPTEEPA